MGGGRAGGWVGPVVGGIKRAGAEVNDWGGGGGARWDSTAPCMLAWWFTNTHQISSISAELNPALAMQMLFFMQWG